MMALFPGLGVFLTGVYSQRRRGERKNCQLKINNIINKYGVPGFPDFTGFHQRLEVP